MYALARVWACLRVYPRPILRKGRLGGSQTTLKDVMAVSIGQLDHEDDVEGQVE